MTRSSKRPRPCRVHLLRRARSCRYFPRYVSCLRAADTPTNNHMDKDGSTHTHMKRRSCSMTCSCSYFSPRRAWAKPFKFVIFGLQKVSKMLPKTPKNIVPILGCFFDAFWCQNDPQKCPQNPQNLDKTAFGAPIFSPTQHKVIPKPIWAPKWSQNASNMKPKSQKNTKNRQML